MKKTNQFKEKLVKVCKNLKLSKLFNRDELGSVFYIKKNVDFKALQKEIENQDYTAQRLNSSKENVDKSSKGKSRIWYILFIVLNIVVVAAFFIKQGIDGDLLPIQELISNKPNWWFILLALSCAILLTIVEGAKFTHLIYKSTKKFRPLLSYKTAALGRYYDNLTPLSAGGEPFQIFYLNKNKINGELSTGIPLAKHIYWLIQQVFLGIICIIFYYLTTSSSSPLLYASWIGLGATVLMLGVIIVFSVSRKIGYSITLAILKLLKKLHIIKDAEKTFKKVLTFVEEYQICIRKFVSSWKVIIVQLALGITATLLQMSIAYFVYLAFCPSVIVSWMSVFAMGVLCDFAVMLIPTPGYSGAAEISFTVLFATLFEFLPGSLPWAMLLWRFFTYYIHIILGLVVTIFDSLSGSRHKKMERGKLAEFVTKGDNINITEEK